MKKAIAPTLKTYLVIDKATGKAEKVQDVRSTYYHSGAVELLLVDGSWLEYETSAVEIVKA